MICPFDLTIRDRTLPMLLDIEPGRLFSDYALGEYLSHNMVPEPELLHVLFRAFKPGDLAVDAGACVGFFTIIMSKLVGPTGSVIAIEPDSRNLAVLRKNLDINDCRNVEIYEHPLGAQDEHQIAFFEKEENGQSSCYDGSLSCNARLVTANSLAAVLGDSVPALLKMDIEGSEFEALRGLEDYGHRIPIIVSEVNPEALKRADSSPEELVGWLYDRGYIPHELRADGGMPAKLYPRFRQKLKIARQNTNMLFCDSKTVVDLWSEVEL